MGGPESPEHFGLHYKQHLPVNYIIEKNRDYPGQVQLKDLACLITIHAGYVIFTFMSLLLRSSRANGTVSIPAWSACAL
eukprot:1155916-Pelagomonas_calceolata.AAC.5